MVDHIHGEIVGIYEQALVVRVGGIAFRCSMPHPERHTKGEIALLHTYLHWSADQGPQLIAFDHEYERSLFTLLISCSGVGPKMALAVIASLGAPTAIEALAHRDARCLATVPGIGLKKAESLCVSLSDKMDTFRAYISQENGLGGVLEDVSAALIALGYAKNEVAATMRALAAKNELKSAPFDVYLRAALAYQSKQA